MNRILIFLSFACCTFLINCKTEPPKNTAPTEIEKANSISPETTIRDITGTNTKRGLIKNTDKATPGYIMFHPFVGTTTYLMNLAGEIVHQWTGDLFVQVAYLKDNGNIVRGETDDDFPVFAAGGQGGRIREYTWEGELIWDFEYANEENLTHHDIELLPNGNILAIAYEVKSPEEVKLAGRKPDGIPKAGLWPDKIIEIEPQKPNGGKIVWEWHLWDHLVQDYDATLPNYGKLSDHPRKININVYHPARPMTQEQLDEMKASGDKTKNATLDNRGSDVSHVNAIHYNEKLDQIAFSSPEYGEIFIIDHSTTTEEAKGSTGGRWGHGGDLLYRWGNPQNYGRGGAADQLLHYQHDIRWIEDGFSGEGHLMLFNNDIPGGKGKFPNAFAAMGATDNTDVSIADCDNYSSIYEFKLPVDKNGAYILPETAAFGPKQPLWDYTAPDKYEFYGAFVSNAHRLQSGNTFINSGPRGRFFEATPTGEIVWEYLNPYVFNYRLPDGTSPTPLGPFIYMQYRVEHLPLSHPAFVGRSLVGLAEQPAVYGE